MGIEKPPELALRGFLLVGLSKGREEFLVGHLVSC